jgi:D-isomer specific 2-hydroxyacid dehydrogenase, catalytic domain
MPVTLLYPEDRQIPDDSLEREIFGPEVRLIRRTKKALSELDPADCAEADGLMIMRYAVLAEDIGRFPRLRAIVRMGVGYDKIDRAAAAARNVWSATCRITARPRSPIMRWRWRWHCAAVSCSITSGCGKARPPRGVRSRTT